jgi:hypothetical protein
VRNSLVHIVFYLAALVVSAALQDMLPPIFGIKPPVMLAVAISLVLREMEMISGDSRSSRAAGFGWMLYVFVIGASSDALGCLPTGCDSGFFLLACVALRMVGGYLGETSRFSLGLISLLIAVPVHETWMLAWGVAGVGAGNPFHSLLSVFPSLIVGGVVFSLMPCLERWVGLDRRSQEVLA